MTVSPSEKSLWLLASSLDFKPDQLMVSASLQDQTISRISSNVFSGYEEFYSKNNGQIIGDKTFTRIAERTFRRIQKAEINLNPKFRQSIQEKVNSLTQNADKRQTHLNESLIGSLILAVEQVFNWILGYGFKTDAQYYHKALDDIKFCSNFIVLDGGLKLSVNQEKKTRLLTLMLKKFLTS